MLSSNLRQNFCYLKAIYILSFTLSSKNNITYSKNKQKNKRVSVHEIIRLIIMEMKMKMKNTSHRYNIKLDLELDMGTNIVNIKIVSVG